jgi:antitoxin PrlF
MAASISRISSKYQTVIPRPVRERLGLKTGDRLRFHFTKRGEVTVEKADANEEDPFASFREWASEEDDRLYRDL